MKLTLYKSYAHYAKERGISRNTKHKHALPLVHTDGKRAGYIDLYELV
jgi:hypothetical protein